MERKKVMKMRKILGTMLLVLSIAQLSMGAGKGDAELNRLLKLAKKKKAAEAKEAAKSGVEEEVVEEAHSSPMKSSGVNGSKAGRSKEKEDAKER